MPASSRTRQFEAVHADLENTVVRLRKTYELTERMELLRRVRLLLKEADTIVEKAPEDSSTVTLNGNAWRKLIRILIGS